MGLHKAVACPHIAHTGIWFHGVNHFCSNICNEEWGFSSSLMQELTLDSEHCYFLFVLSFHSRADFYNFSTKLDEGHFVLGICLLEKIE